MNRILTFAILLGAACSPAQSGPATLTVMTHDSFSASEGLIRSFESANNAHVSFLQSGDAGAALNKAILTHSSPLADVLFGVDNTFLARALEADLFEAYDSAALAGVPDQFRLDPTNRLLPVDYGDVCINYDKSFFVSRDLPIPSSLEDLLRPEYQGMLVVENPASSSPGLAFLMATVARFGDPGFLEFWGDLRLNDVVVVDGWETAYYTNFSGSSGRGPQPMVVSYASSPAAEVMFAPLPPSDAPTAIISAPGSCFRQIEFVGVLKGARAPDLARSFIDFMLAPVFQADVPEQMFVYPVLPGVELPATFAKYAQVPSGSATLAPDLIAEYRDSWIAAWTDVVLH